MASSLNVRFSPAVAPAVHVQGERGALLALALAALLPALGTSIAHVGLPTLAVVFAAPFRSVQWVVIAYLLMVMAFVVVAGRAGDLVGRKRLLLAGIALFTLASIACGVAASLPLLIAARVVQGLGAAAMMAIAMAMVGDAIPRERFGRAMGLMGSMSAVGTGLGPSVGGVLLGALGWRSMFVAMVPMGLIAFAVSARFLKSAPREAMKARSLRVSIALLRDRRLAVGFSSSALVSTVIMSTLVVGPFYLSRALGLEAAVVGLVIAIGPVVAAIAAIPAGRLVDRYGARRTTIMGLASVASGCVAMGALPLWSGIAGYVLSIIIVTGGYAMFQTANNSSVMADVSPESRGVVSGLLNLSRNLGLVTGAAVMGAVFASGAGSVDIAIADGAAVVRGMHNVFILAAALTLGALALIRVSPAHTSPHPRQPSPAQPLPGSKPRSP